MAPHVPLVQFIRHRHQLCWPCAKYCFRIGIAVYGFPSNHGIAALILPFYLVRIFHLRSLLSRYGVATCWLKPKNMENVRDHRARIRFRGGKIFRISFCFRYRINFLLSFVVLHRMPSLSLSSQAIYVGIVVKLWRAETYKKEPQLRHASCHNCGSYCNA